MDTTRPEGPTELAWMEQAACRDEDPELFFPISAKGAGLAQVAEAKEVCRGCPVREACLRYALDTGQEGGVWGGLTEEERRALRRRGSRVRSVGLAPAATPRDASPPNGTGSAATPVSVT